MTPTFARLAVCTGRQVKVADRTAFVTEQADTVLVSPPGIQLAVDELVGRAAGGRSFVRPSGTEDVVRVYAEAATADEAAALSAQVSAVVHELGGGVGPAPGDGSS